MITDDELEIPLESQSLSTFGRNFASADWDAVRLVAHELAHQWFGNAVTLREWKDIWLHEGFACYAEWLWSEESGGDSGRRRRPGHHAKLADLDQDLLLADPGPALMFDDRVYKRGALHPPRPAHRRSATTTSSRSCGPGSSRFGGGNADDGRLRGAGRRDQRRRRWTDLFDAWLRSTDLPPLPA